MTQPAASIIVPTFNRADLWRSGWLLDQLLDQTRQDFELIIIDDDSTDDSLAIIAERLTISKRQFGAQLVQRVGPRPKPKPASALPDNVGFGLASSPTIIHLDDDLKPDTHLVEAVLDIDLSHTVLWMMLNFRNEDGSAIPGRPGLDSRKRFAGTMKPTVDLPAWLPVHWGGAYALATKSVRTIGGHCIEHAGWRNSDTRLGERLVKAGLKSVLGTVPALAVLHLGPTWYRLNFKNFPLVAKCRLPAGREPVVCNGGQAYWKSIRFKSSFKPLQSWPPTQTTY